MKKITILAILFYTLGCGQIPTKTNYGVNEPQSTIGPDIITVKHTYYTNYFDTLYNSEIMGKYVQTISNSLITVDTSRNINRKLVAEFKEDPLIPARFETATNEFYSKYNKLHKTDGKMVDKGHENPYSAFDFNEVAASESMYIQNTCPQFSFFNRHQWEAVEQHVIKQVSLVYDENSKHYKPNQDSITVYTGVLISKNKITDGENHYLYIPDYYWKVISYKKGGVLTYEAWLGPNTVNNDTNPDDIKTDVSKLHSFILSYYPNLKLEF